MPAKARTKPTPQTDQTKFRWDDARILLALHRTGTLAGAAAALNVDASTIGRRIEALETALSMRLFERTPDGAIPTAATQEILHHAQAMERAALELAGSATTFEREVSGVVRLSLPPGVADFFIVPLLPQLRARYPQLRLELDTRVGYVDLARREADLVLRSRRPERGDLITVRVGQSRMLPYLHQSLARTLGRLRALEDVPWITYGPELSDIPDAAWILSAVQETSILLRVSSFSAQLAAVEAGVGVTLIPEVLGESRPQLARLDLSRRLAASLPEFPESQLWLATHRSMRAIPRVAATWDFIVEHAPGATRGDQPIRGQLDPTAR